MIRLFSHTETDFTHNGIHVLDDIVIGDTCILTNGINEIYSLEMEVAIFNNSKWRDIEAEMFLRVPTTKGEQIFRIKEVVKGFSTLRIYAKHVFFDLENNFILDTNVVQKDGRSAIAQILGGITNNSINTFNGTSDITVVNNSRLVRKNVVTALIGDIDNSFLNRWGGELQLDNFNFAINKRIGQDRGFQIRYGKNATGYEGNINTYNLCTRIVPVGFDGIMLEGTKWVDSPNITKYPQIYTYEVKFEDIKVKENPEDEEGYNTIEEAREALRQAALNHFNNTKCDLPSFSARVNFITLQNTEEYKDVKSLERVELGDDVSIYLSSIDVNASSRIVRTKYNFFTQKYVEVEVGDIKPNLFKQLINIKDTIDNIVEDLGGNTWQDIINKSLDEATKLMEEGLKGSHVITMKNQIVIGDAPDIKNMVNCIVINKNGIGFSNNGYLPDRLISAMTIDGKINASCITTGQLNAALIKTGMLMSANGTTWIDMENGTFNFANKINFDGANFDIDLSGKDLATNTSVDTKFEINNEGINETIKNTKEGLETEIKKNAEAITQKVSNSDFNSYKNQTANEISQKVSNGDFGTLFKQTAYGFDFIGKITTKSDNYKLELNANKLIGFRGSETHNPMYSAGVWWPNGAPAGYVSVSKGNAETVDTNGALWMTAYPNDNDKAAGIQYMKKHNDGTYVGSIIEFSEAGSISLVSQKTTGAARYGLWSHPDGYIYPYQGDEQLGSNIKPWNKMYCNNLYYKNYSTPFSNSTLAESYQVTALNEEVSRTLVTSEVEKYKDDNSFYTFYKDKFESLVYTDGGNKDRLVVNPNSMLNDPIASILVSKDGDELLLDNNSYITSLTMALKRSIEKIEKLEDRIKVLEGGF